MGVEIDEAAFKRDSDVRKLAHALRSDPASPCAGVKPKFKPHREGRDIFGEEWPEIPTQEYLDCFRAYMSSTSYVPVQTTTPMPEPKWTFLEEVLWGEGIPTWVWVAGALGLGLYLGRK